MPDITDNTSYARLEPVNTTLETWQVKENMNLPVPDGSNNKTIPQCDIVVPKIGLIYTRRDYNVITAHGDFYGEAISQSKDYFPLTTHSGVQASLLSHMHRFNTWKQIRPFVGNLYEYWTYLCEIVGYPVDKSLVFFDKDRVYRIYGEWDNVFDHFTKFLTSIEYNWIWAKNMIVIEPYRRFKISADFAKDSMPQIDYTDSKSKKRNIHVIWREPTSTLDEWSVVFPVDVTQSVLDETEPTNPMLNPSTAASITDSVTGFNDKPTSQDFNLLASILDFEEPFCSLIPCAEVARAGDEVWAFVEGNWSNRGTLRNTVSNPSYLSTLDHYKQYAGGQWVYCTSNEVIYLCTVGYQPADTSKNIEEIPAQFAQWGTNFHIAKDTPANEIPSHFIVAADDDIPVMPQQFNDNSGYLKITLLDNTKSIRIELNAPYLPYKPELGVWARTPDNTWPYNEPHPDDLSEDWQSPYNGQIIAFDLSAPDITDQAMYYVYNHTGAMKANEPRWAYDDSIEPFSSTNYRVAIPTYEHDYDGLHLRAHALTWQDGKYEYINPDVPPSESVDGDEDKIEIDNYFIQAQGQARECASSVDLYSNGVEFTVSLSARHMTDSLWVRSLKGSFDFVSEWLMLNAFGWDGAQTFDEASDFFMANGWETFDDVSKAAMEADGIHISVQEFSRLVGSRMTLPNRATFLITDAVFDPSGIKITGYEMSTLDDWDDSIWEVNGRLTLDGWDEQLKMIEHEERFGVSPGFERRYDLATWDQEPLRTHFDRLD